MKQSSLLHRTAVPLDGQETSAAAAAPDSGEVNHHPDTTPRRFYFLVGDWVWWTWALTALLLVAGICGIDSAFLGAMIVTLVQAGVVLMRDRQFTAFSVQLRVAYLLLLTIAYPEPMRWLYWLPAVGTLALTVFGYCILARILSLLPWVHRERYSVARLRRTFFSAPNLNRVAHGGAVPGGLCTVEAQVAPASEDR